MLKCCSALLLASATTYQSPFDDESRRRSNRCDPKTQKNQNCITIGETQSYSHAGKLRRLRRLSSDEVQLLLLVMQNDCLEVLRQYLETSIVKVFLLRPRASLRRLIADADIARRPATGETCEVVHLLRDHLRAFGGFVAALALCRHRHLNRSCSRRQSRLA